MTVPENIAAAFKDPSVSEFIVNPDGAVYVERAGALERLAVSCSPADALVLVSALVGTDERFGPQRPYADLTGLDGSRIHVMAPPVARGGVCVTIRKRPARRPGLGDLVANATLTPSCADFLRYAVERRRNILIAGAASSGKTSLLNALASLADPRERILVLEDTPELVLPQPHAIYLKTRLRDAAGLPDVTLHDLVVNTLRMRPDRLIVGEVRSVEAADLLEAMNVGQEGVLSTLHANSPREALLRLETLVLMAGFDMPVKAIRSNIVLAVDLIVFMARLSDGSRRVERVTEITGMELETISLSDLFVMETRKNAQAASFQLKPTGVIPRFYDQLRKQGVEPPLQFFKT